MTSRNLKTVTFNTKAIDAMKYASLIAKSSNKRLITPDTMFLGIYAYIQTTNYFDIFCNIFWLDDITIIDEILYDYEDALYQYDYEDLINHEVLKFNSKLSFDINRKNTQKQKLDIFALFKTSFDNMSSSLKDDLIDDGLDHEKLIQTFEILSKNTVILDGWLFAFMDLIAKIISELNLDINNIKIMDIKNIWDWNSIKSNINGFSQNNADNSVNPMDSLGSDIMDDWNKSDDNTSPKGTTTKQDKKESKKLNVDYFGTELVGEFKNGFLDPVIWREQEIEQVVFTLLRKTKNNPLLIWEAGVGKTAIVEWLAQKIHEWKVPNKLKNKKVYLLDMGTLLAGTKYRWEFEARMKAILEEAMDESNNIILFIDELHTIIGAGGQDNNDAAQMIKPLLARWKIKLIGATTHDEYQKHIEKDAALKRRFQEVMVWEPSDEDTYKILSGLKKIYENYHGVKITDEAIKKSISLSQRYMLNRHLPDKAFDVLDEASARKSTITQKLENDDDYKKLEKKRKLLLKDIEKAIDSQDYFLAAELKEKSEKMKKELSELRNNKNIPEHLRPEVSSIDVGNVVAEKVWIPANLVNESEIEKLKNLESILKEKIFWQQDAVNSVVRTITRNRLSMVEKQKPVWSFLFLGPTWTGKTYLAKLIAKEYFGDEKALIRIDMSEYMEKFSVSKLIGSPAGYVWYDEWGQLTESVRRKPYSVLLFDEVEKASPDVLNILLQIMDEGRLKDSKWRWIDFKSTIIIMTSNLGSEEFSKKQSSIGFDTNKSDTEVSEKNFEIIQSKVMTELKDFMSPELINRIDYKMVFKPLSKTTLCKIFKKNIKDFLAVWKKNKDIKIPKFTDQRIRKIVDEIYDPQYGARPVERYIHDKIEDEMINQILNP